MYQLSCTLRYVLSSATQILGSMSNPTKGMYLCQLFSVVSCLLYVQEFRQADFLCKQSYWMSAKEIQRKTKPSTSVTCSVIEMIERLSEPFGLGHIFKGLLCCPQFNDISLARIILNKNTWFQRTKPNTCCGSRIKYLGEELPVPCNIELVTKFPES
jgi:hypothetical protein